MKFISNEDYKEFERLKELALDVKFWKEKVKVREDDIEVLEKEVRDNQEKHDKKVENMRLDHDIKMKRKDAEIDVKVLTATEEARKKNETLTNDNIKYKTENEVLTKAFDNMGLDVKDVKGMMDKLVDGLISKNQIQLIKSN